MRDVRDLSLLEEHFRKGFIGGGHIECPAACGGLGRQIHIRQDDRQYLRTKMAQPALHETLETSSKR